MANARGSSRNAYGSAARRSGASSGTAKRPAAKTSAPRGRRHRLLGVLSVIFAALALVCSVLRMLPEDLQALPYIPVIVSATPWFVILAVLALILSVISRRWIAMLMALACIGLQVWWQWPFFSASTKLPAAVDAAMASTRADTGDMIARVMTFNVYNIGIFRPSRFAFCRRRLLSSRSRHLSRLSLGRCLRIHYQSGKPRQTLW